MKLTFESVDQFCSGIDLNTDHPVMDLSQIQFFRPFALVYLGMFLRYHNSRGKQFTVLIPEHTSARNYLAQQNFWERFNFNPESINTEKLRHFSGNTSLNDIVDIERRPNIAEEIAERVKRVIIRNRVKIPCSIITVLVCELVDNFAIHSRSNLAAVAMQYYPNLRRLVFAVGDCGVGIRSSLSVNNRHAHLLTLPHCEAALKAFEPLVSGLPEGGTGLTEVREETCNLGGRLMLTTGDGYVIMSSERVNYGNMVYDLPGVQMELSLPESLL